LSLEIIKKLIKFKQGDKDKILVKPIKFPVTLTQYNYKLEKQNYNVLCNGIGYYRQKIREKHFLVSPPGKILCFAQIYINPVPCTFTSSREVGKNDLRNMRGILPTTTLRPIFDYRIETDALRRIDATKCCTFYIHVEIHKPDWVYHLINQRKVAFHYVDKMYGPIIPEDLYFSNPYKLSYWIEYSEKIQLFKVTHKILIGCYDYKDFYHHIQPFLLHCKTFSKTDTQSCFHYSPIKYTSLKDVAILDANSKIQLMSQSFQTICSKPFVYTYEKTLETYPSNFYLGQYMPSETGLYPIFIKLLFPNSTVLTNDELIPQMVQFLFSRLLNHQSIVPNSLFVSSTPFDAVHFVTCAPIQQRKLLSLLGYISAFDFATWIIILLSYVLSIKAWNWSLAKTKPNAFSAVFILKILLGQSTNEIQKVRLITGAWVLTGLFLSYNYQGNNIDQLTSPFAPRKFETFDEVLSNNFTLYSLPLEFDYIKYSIARSTLGIEHDYKHWSERFNLNELSFVKLYLHQNIKNATSVLKDALERIVKTPADWWDMNNMLQFDYYVDRISKCEQDVYTDILSYVNKLRSNLIKKNVGDFDISQSKTSYGQTYQFWKLSYIQMPAEYYSRRRLGLIESGIINLWSVWKNRVESWNDTVEGERKISSSSEAKPISLDGNTIVVFYVHLTCKAVCLFVFMCECIQRLITLNGNAGKLVFSELKELCSRCFVGAGEKTPVIQLSNNRQVFWDQ